MSNLHKGASAAGAAGEPGLLENINGTLKWYCAVRGYGFIAPEKQQPPITGDVIVYRDTLMACGHEEIFEGQRVVCDAAVTKDGLRAVTLELRVPTLDGRPGEPGVAEVPALFTDRPVFTDMPVQVIPIHSNKGFAFLAATDDGALTDIFLSPHIIRDSGLVDLGIGKTRWLLVDVGLGPKGYVAVAIRLARERPGRPWQPGARRAAPNP